MKKLICLVLCLFLVLCSFAAIAEVDFFAKYDEPVTVTSVKNLGAGNLDFPEGDSIDDNVWTREYLEDLNINLMCLCLTYVKMFV